MNQIRSSEKNRESTCIFADRVANLVINQYRLVCPEDLKNSYKQTVLAGFVLQIPIKNHEEANEEFDELTNDELNKESQIKLIEENNHKNEVEFLKTRLIVVSIGVGTKVLNKNIIENEKKLKNNIKKDYELINDMHGEILARRGFHLFLFNSIKNFLESSEDEKVNHLFLTYKNSLFKLKKGVKIHFYTSSQPCGNASLRKWGKPSKERFLPEYSYDDYPIKTHPPFFIMAKKEGQIAVLTKINTESEESFEFTEDIEIPSIKKPKVDKSGGNILVDSKGLCFPIGTSPVYEHRGNIMTCSDKIALWNVLGIQGSFLLNYFNSPLYLSSVIIGRKFNEIHSNRALCCRISQFKESFIHLDKSIVEFKTNHPSMMSTKVKFDDSVFETNSEIQASFNEHRTFVSWLNSLDFYNKKISRNLILSELTEKEIIPIEFYSYNIINSKTGLDSNGYSSKISNNSLYNLYEKINPPSLIGEENYYICKEKITHDKKFFCDWIKK